jgi:hypothetical protein
MSLPNLLFGSCLICVNFNETLLSFIISAKCLLVTSKSLNLSFILLNKTSIVIVLFFLISSKANLTCSFLTLYEIASLLCIFILS